MAELNLLSSYPKAKRNIKARVGNKEENRRIALEFGMEYFDGTREQGYGGYRYDGRWIPIAEKIVKHFGLKPGDRVLDIGCAKGFLVKDLMKVCPGLEVFGIDVSEYAVINCEPEVVGRLQVGNAMRLPFPDNSFKAAISINTVHNLDRDGCIQALREMQRVAPGRGFMQVDAYRNEAERQVFEDWMLTARTYGKPEDWIRILDEAGYTGDYFWTILEIDPEWTVT
jgi:cyclopropane fatty-acyl-phospholipid synthase-like methyltransferase